LQQPGIPIEPVEIDPFVLTDDGRVEKRVTGRKIDPIPVMTARAGTFGKDRDTGEVHIFGQQSAGAFRTGYRKLYERRNLQHWDVPDQRSMNEKLVLVRTAE
jgi:hypothetical protein